MVGDDAKGDSLIQRVGFLDPFAGVDVCIGFPTQCFQFAEDRLEDVGRVIGWLLREVTKTFSILNDGAGAFESHAGIDMLGRKIAEATIGLSIVLNEDQIPDLDTEVGIFIHQTALRVAVWSEIDMEFRAGTAGAGLAHHPEVVLLVTVDDMHSGVESGSGKDSGPVGVCFVIERSGISRVGPIDGGVEAFRREAPYRSQ